VSLPILVRLYRRLDLAVVPLFVFSLLLFRNKQRQKDAQSVTKSTCDDRRIYRIVCWYNFSAVVSPSTYPKKYSPFLRPYYALFCCFSTTCIFLSLFQKLFLILRCKSSACYNEQTFCAIDKLWSCG
jgi:hypothetical protein